MNSNLALYNKAQPGLDNRTTILHLVSRSPCLKYVGSWHAPLSDRFNLSNLRCTTTISSLRTLVVHRDGGQPGTWSFDVITQCDNRPSRCQLRSKTIASPASSVSSAPLLVPTRITPNIYHMPWSCLRAGRPPDACIKGSMSAKHSLCKHLQTVSHHGKREHPSRSCFEVLLPSCRTALGRHSFPWRLDLFHSSKHHKPPESE